MDNGKNENIDANRTTIWKISLKLKVQSLERARNNQQNCVGKENNTPATSNNTTTKSVRFCILICSALNSNCNK